MMADEPENLISEYLRRFDRRFNDLDAKLDRILDDVHMIKIRLTSVEEALVGVHRRVDRIEERIDRIERRLGLTEMAH